MVKDAVQRKAPPIPKALLPVGNIVRLNETEKAELGANVETVPAPKTDIG
jgi:hypothetical protein